MKREEILRQIRQCNVSYHLPGQTDRSAMPLGNGELCASVWVDQTGSICMYLSRSDAKTEYDRTVKLGMLKVNFSSNPFRKGTFLQELHLTEGMIEIKGQNGNVRIWTDRKKHALRMTADFPENITITPEIISWRTENIVPAGEFASDGDVFETPDIIENYEGGTLFYHKNGKTIIEETAKLEGMGDYTDLIPDLLTDRIFGGYLSCRKAGSIFECSVMTHSAQISVSDFRRYLIEETEALDDAEDSRRICREWWESYWTKSYIFVENDPDIVTETDPGLIPFIKEPMEYSCSCTSAVTRAYTLTKYMTACCSAGEFPILYNGMLFNLCPGENRHFSIERFGRSFTAQPEEFSPQVNPDERTWTTEHLWQNIRHPYHSMLARGETDEMKVLFKYYRRFWDLDRKRAELYYHASGQHNTEMTMSFGLQSMSIYGTDRTGKPDGYAQNRWGGAVDISPGLELICMMLDYYDYTEDIEFLDSMIIPYAKDILEYIATRFKERKDGKIVVGPVNCIETYWDTINPVPIIAGMKACADRILQIGAIKSEIREWMENYQKMIPEFSVDELLLPAEQYKKERQNVEIPELYAIFPFKVIGFDEKTRKLAENTFTERIREFDTDKVFKIKSTPGTASYSGWQYIGQVAAMLGMKEFAGRILSDNCSLQNPGTRFPAMWGPIYDAVPDTDHGANILNQLQTMILQIHEDGIGLLEGFPEEWDVQFRLFADKDTVVEGEYRNRKWLKRDILKNRQ